MWRVGILLNVPYGLTRITIHKSSSGPLKTTSFYHQNPSLRPHVLTQSAEYHLRNKGTNKKTSEKITILRKTRGPRDKTETDTKAAHMPHNDNSTLYNGNRSNSLIICAVASFSGMSSQISGSDGLRASRLLRARVVGIPGEGTPLLYPGASYLKGL